MARTKKYLVTSKASRTQPGFYRPLKRLATSSYREPDVPYHSVIRREENPADLVHLKLAELEDHITQVKQLKSELSQKMRDLSSQQSQSEILQNSVNDSPSHSRRLPTTEGRSVQPKNSHESLQRNESHNCNDDELDFKNHSVEEKILLLEKELEHSLNKESQFKEEIDTLKESFLHERQQLESTIKDLRKDLHRTEPIQNNKFFSISKELQEIVSAMNHLVENENLSTQSSVPSPSATVVPTTPTTPVSADGQNQQQTTVQTPITPPVSPTPPPQTDESTPKTETPASPTPPAQPQTTLTPSPTPAPLVTEPEKKGLLSKVPKPIIVLATTLFFVFALGGAGWYFLNRSTEVNTSLVQEYLPPESQQQLQQTQPEAQEKKIDEMPAASQEPTPAQPSTPPQPETKGASDDKYAASQANVPFAETKWETLKDPTFGIEINYPVNAVNVIKTDSSITFIRKTGYVFKIQAIETGLDVKEYWKLIQTSSLKYKVKETTFRDRPALFLELEDFSEYPGDKYFVKYNDYILDIWYATYSNTLSDDDAKRIDIMLNSLKFIK